MGRVELAQEDADGRDVQRGQVELVHLQMKREMWKSVKPYEKVVPGECFSLMSYVVLGYAFQQRGRWWRWPRSSRVFLWRYRFRITKAEMVSILTSKIKSIWIISAISTRATPRRGSRWEDLVIPPTYRPVLVALVESHSSRSMRQTLSCSWLTGSSTSQTGFSVDAH